MVITEDYILAGIKSALNVFSIEVGKGVGNTKKDYVFAGVLFNDNLKFSILLGAKWLDSFRSESEVLRLLIPYLRSSLADNLHMLNNVSVIKSDDQLAQDLGLIRSSIINRVEEKDEFPEVSNVHAGSNHFDKIHLL